MLKPSSVIIKTCSCKRSYTQEAWEGLKRIGTNVLLGETDRDPATLLELRNCVCGSTIAVQLRELAPLVDPADASLLNE